METENTSRCRIFILSPAYAGGERARMILSDHAEYELPRKLCSKRGAPIAEVFTFLSVPCFRGKIFYATAFARPAPGIPVANWHSTNANAGARQCLHLPQVNSGV